MALTNQRDTFLTRKVSLCATPYGTLSRRKRRGTT
jgi:hypothetical protein